MKTIISFFLFFFLCLVNLSGYAQRASPEYDRGWITFSLGKANPLDLSPSVTANFGRSRFWQVSFQQAGEFNFFSDSGPREVTNIGGGYGYSWVDRIGRIAVSAGPGIAFGINDSDGNDNETHRFFTAGVTGNAQLILSPIKELGLGIELFGNLNPEISTYGFRLSFAIEGHK